MKQGGHMGSVRSARRQGSPYPKAELGPRIIARLLDLAVAGLFAWMGLPGLLVALAYLLFADALPHGQSPGKRLMGLRVVHIPSRRPAGPVQAMVRNLPIAACFALHPVLAGLLAIPVLGFELYMLYTDPLGIRIGDIFSDTQVIDAKVPLEAMQPTDLLVRPPPAAAHSLDNADMGEPA